MDDLRAGFEDGYLRPLPVQTWSLDHGIDAYAAVGKGATSNKHVLRNWRRFPMSPIKEIAEFGEKDPTLLFWMSM